MPGITRISVESTRCHHPAIQQRLLGVGRWVSTSTLEVVRVVPRDYPGWTPDLVQGGS
jgi:hypothetical protein